MPQDAAIGDQPGPPGNTTSLDNVAAPGSLGAAVDSPGNQAELAGASGEDVAQRRLAPCPSRPHPHPHLHPPLHNTDVLVVGMAARGPGFNTASQFFSALLEKRDLVDKPMAGKDRFDHSFFQKSWHEASYTDPQIRFLLELTYEAFIDAGASDLSKLPRPDIGVYVGSSFADFHSNTLAHGPADGYEHIGAAGAMLANTISRVFQFGGVSMKIDSACSSSLQAFDAACHDIRSGKCKMAVVAGSNVILDEQITHAYEKLGLVSTRQDGACRAFCKDADGYVRKEAVVVMILSQRTEMEAHGLTRYAEVVGHKSVAGSGNSATSPSEEAQERLYSSTAAMAAPRLPEAATVRFVECHGTGTLKGDAVETSVLADALGAAPSASTLFSRAQRPLAIGSVKSNVGHTESASGLLGLLKAILSLENGCVPPNLHYTHAHRNPKCTGLGDGSLRVVTGEAEPLEHDAVVAVNSFGFGGTYVQVLLRGLPPTEEGHAPLDAEERWKNINPLMGRTPEAARAIAKAVEEHRFQAMVALPHCTGPATPGIRAFTTPIAKRIFVETEAIPTTATTTPKPRQPVWVVFSGNGGVWRGMGAELYAQSARYRQFFSQCDEYLQSKWNCDALKRLQMAQGSAAMASFENIVDATVSLVALQMCLIELLKMVGFTRDVCDGFVGHSAGEIAAGYFDQCYGWDTALDIAFVRAEVAAQMAARAPGVMCAVQGLTREAVERVLAHVDSSSVCVACCTSHLQVTLSGTVAGVEAAKELLASKHADIISLTDLNTFGAAFHSSVILDTDVAALNDRLSAIFEAHPLDQCKRSEKWISSCFERGDPRGASVGPAYHCHGFRNCAEFYRAVKGIPSNAVIVECGPRGSLRSAFKGNAFYALLSSKQNAVDSLASVYGHLFLHGIPLSGAIAERALPRDIFPAPAHRHVREMFVAWSHNHSFNKYLDTSRGPAAMTVGASPIQTLTLDLTSEERWLRNRKIAGVCLLPAAVYLAAIRQACLSKFPTAAAYTIHDFEIHAPVDTHSFTTLQLDIEFSQFGAVDEPVSGGSTEARHAVAVRANGERVAKCSVLHNAKDGAARRPPPPPDRSSSESRVPTVGDDSLPSADRAAVYNKLGRHGYEYTGCFRVLADVSASRDTAQLHVEHTDYSSSPEDFTACALLLEGMLQLSILNHLGGSQYGKCLLPVRIKSVRLEAKMTGIKAASARVLKGQGHQQHQPTVLSGCSLTAHGREVAVLTGLELAPGLSSDMLTDVETMELRPKRLLCSSYDVPHAAYCNSEGQRVLVGGAEHDAWHLSVLPCDDGAGGEHTELSSAAYDINFKAWQEIILSLRQRLGTDGPPVLLMSRAAGFPGFVRSLQKEPGFEHVRGLAMLSALQAPPPKELLRLALSYFEQNATQSCLFVRDLLSTDGHKVELLVDDTQPVEGVLDVKRFLAPKGSFLVSSPGQPSFNHWQPLPCVPSLPHDDEGMFTVQVKFASLNFRDVMVRLGKLPRSRVLTGYGRRSSGLGLDFAGVAYDPTDDPKPRHGGQSTRVIGLGRDCISTTLSRQPEYLCWTLKENQELEEFATVPCAYATAYYALCVRGRLQKDHKVLIHCGAGGVGLAALRLCQQRLGDVKSQLFVTCGSEKKREYLHNAFGIPKENIGDSRSCCFRELVAKRTNSAGVDLVLNSLVGEEMEASIACLSFGGLFLELGKGDIGSTVLDCLRRDDRQLVMIDLDQIMAKKDKFQPVRALLEQGLSSGEVVPLHHSVFSAPHETDAAFNFMLKRDRIGKVVLKIDHSVAATPLDTLADTTLVRPATQEHLVAIVGGFGGLGRCLSQLFAERFGCGCQLVLCTRKEGDNRLREERQRYVEGLRMRYGVEASIFTGDLSRPAEVHRLMTFLRQRGPTANLWGIFHAAARTHDAAFERMSENDWSEPMAAKVSVMRSLGQCLDDEQYADLTATLNFFVCFSSVVAGDGNAGQTNYAFANSSLEHFVRERVQRGKPAVCIRLGLVQHTGLATNVKSHTDLRHLCPLSAEGALDAVERILALQRPGVYAVYGKRLASANAIKPQAQQVILDALNDHSPGSPDLSEVPWDTHMDIILNDSLAFLRVKEELRRWGYNVAVFDEDFASLALSEFMDRLLPSASMATSAEAEGSDPPARTSTSDVVVIVPIGPSSLSRSGCSKLTSLARAALLSVQAQTHDPYDIIVVLEEDDAQDDAAPLKLEIRSILPCVRFAASSRSKCPGFGHGSRFGSLNAGILASFEEAIAPSPTSHASCWIATIDLAADKWAPEHLERCVSAAAAAPSCQIVAATDADVPSSPSVFGGSLEGTLALAHRGRLFVRRALLLEAGMFDEAFKDEPSGGLADLDLFIRIADIIAAQNLASEGDAWCAATGEQTVCSTTMSDVDAHGWAPYGKSGYSDNLPLFLYKHHARMTTLHAEHLCTFGNGTGTATETQEAATDMPECRPTPLRMWNGDDILLRRDTFDVFAGTQPASLDPRVAVKMLVGVITSSAARVQGLLSDLGSALDDPKHGVVVFVNAQDAGLATHIKQQLQAHAFRAHVILSTDRIVMELAREWPDGRGGGAVTFPLPIAQSRTVLQTFLAAATEVEQFDAVAVLDDDMRLPRTWGMRPGAQQDGDIFLSRSIMTPPNPTALSIRTQLLDFLYALDRLHPHPQAPNSPVSDNSWRCPSFEIYHRNLQDQYYDLSSTRWDHLEVPRRFESLGDNEFVERCRKKIFVGDPLAREAVSVEVGESVQRGSCMVLPRASFSLLRTAHEAPLVELASGRRAASRRSDTFWVQRHRAAGKRPVVVTHLSALHDNTHDLIPSPEKVREVAALEMIGAILCRPVGEERVAFAQRRTAALRSSTARIRGICKMLRSRPYFGAVPGLVAFVEELEAMFAEHLWHRDVHSVVAENLKRLKDWDVHRQAERHTVRNYRLDTQERMFLGQGQSCTPSAYYPSASDLRGDGPHVPIPCLHRIHEDSQPLRGAQRVQEQIGMSLPRSQVEASLRHLARLHEMYQPLTGREFNKALVTMDDGFRDVLLLCDIFNELRASLQPVLFVPSGLLRGEAGKRQHLPLTCLYSHCAAQGIDAEDGTRLGRATRSELKRLPEEQQHQRLEEAGIAIDWPTDDLLTPADLCKLGEAGWWIAMHGPDHSDLTRAPNIVPIAEQLQQDVARNNWTPWFAWPEGLWCARVADALTLRVAGLSAQFGLSRAPPGETDHPAVLRRAPWIGGARRQRVLVTGGHGFLGNHLCLLLLSYGYEVFSFDIEDGQDILDQDAFMDELREKQINVCVHLAAVADLNDAEARPEAAIRINVEGTKAVLAGCDACGVRLLFASTCCAYGNNGAEVNDETARLAPTELYAETKVEGEQLVLASTKLLELRHVVMRLATFYGPDMREALATARFLQAAITGTAIRIHGTGEQTRCYTHVHDVAEGIRVILQESSFSGVVNVSDDRECSVSELAQAAMRAAGRCVDVVHEADRVGQIRHSLISNARLRALGNRAWRPTISLEQGLAQCAALMKSGLPSSKGRDTTAMAAPVLGHSPPIDFTPISLELPTRWASASKAWVSKKLPDGTQLVAVAAGDLTRASVVAARIHSECLFGDVLGSLKCDCGPQKDDFLSAIGNSHPGVFVYVKGHEGRGAGLDIKSRAYADIDRNPHKHHNEALLQAGAASEDMRTFTWAATFLLGLLDSHKAPSGAASTPADAEQAVEIQLYTNNPAKVKAMAEAASRWPAAHCRFACHHQTVAAEGHCNSFNEKYLREKEQDNGHAGLRVRRQPPNEQGGVLTLPDNIDPLPSTTPKINSHVFEACDSSLFDFLKEHGFVVVRGLVTSQQVKEAMQQNDRILQHQFGEVRAEVGDEVEYEEFAQGVSQLRDLCLWNDEDNIFKRLTCDKGPTTISRMAQRAMATVDPEGQWDGIRLLYDHIVKKPPAQASKKIPLHQDSMFWPVDVPACSTWTILSEAPLDGGCIEVLDLRSKPHLHRQQTVPVDFMGDELGNGLRLVLENDGQPVRWFVPMRTGETLIFPSNTWHRSSPNMREDLNRIAYIQTWAHPRARWRPDLVPWHPINEYLQRELSPNDFLTGKRHPLVDYSEHYAGTAGEEPKSRSVYWRRPPERGFIAPKQSVSSISMFDAGNVVQTQIRNILAIHLGEPNAAALSLIDILKESSQFRARIVKTTLDAGITTEPDALLAKESGCDTASDQLLWALKKLVITVACYKRHRSRNIFDSTYAAWWTLAGAAWNTHFLDGPFDSRYMLCNGDVGSFLKRIRVARGDHDMNSNTGQLAFLEAVVAGFFEHIPFQNFTMLARTQRAVGGSGWQRRPPKLGEIISDMLAGYGGLCSSRNPFLLLLLKAAGFSDVSLVSGTMCSPHLGKIRDNMHTALLVGVGGSRYWVDVANGFPYVRPVALPLRDGDTSAVIRHPFCSTVLARKDGRIVVRHRFRDSLGNERWRAEGWIDNYHFAPEPVEYAVFHTMLERHYDLDANTGPFLKNLRFNLWTTNGGVTLLGDGSKVWAGEGLAASPFLFEADSVSHFEAWISKHGLQVEPGLARLLPEAWVQCRCGKGDIEPAEDITVTGGFFDGSATAYLGGVTVWRAAGGVKRVVALTFRTHREYVPEDMPVVNKGFAGGCWRDGRLYVCWPNRVAVVAPAAEWNIQRHIDNPQFNDLHHVHADADGLWVANTGMDCIDHLDFAGGLLSRTCLLGEGSGSGDSSLDDIRDQRAHDARRGRDKEHINHVTVEDASDGTGPHLAATLLQSKRVVRVQEGTAGSLDSAVQLKRTSPPHEGFVCCAPSLHETPLRWNSTIDGLVLATEPRTGDVVRSWDLSRYVGHPRGWTRGLCVLEDGFLVGSTVIRGTAKEWLSRHENTWNFDTGDSKTAVVYVPFTAMPHGEGVVSVDVMTERAAKIFSLLPTPPEAS